MVSVASTTAAIKKRGRPATLRRIVSGSNIDVMVTAVVTGGTPSQLAGSIQQNEVQAVIGPSEIAAAGWPAPPQDNDRLIMADGHAYSLEGNADVFYLGTSVAYYLLRMRG